jgi:hypothetical protein
MKIKVTAPSREELITYLAEVIDDLREGLSNGSMGVPGEPPRYRWAELAAGPHPAEAIGGKRATIRRCATGEKG